MAIALRLREATATGPTDPAAYAAALHTILAQIGTTVGSAETAAVRLLDDARRQVQDILKNIAVDAPSRGMYERARAGIDQALANLAADMGTTIAGYQAQGFALGVDLAIKPLGGEKGLEVVAAAVSQTQLAILSSYSADLIQNLTADVRRRVNGELAAVIIGAKSPYAASLAIGKNLADPNHFSTIAHRARAIVVTEVGRAHALATQASLNQLQASFDAANTGDKVRKRWLNAHLPGARITHLEAEAAYGPDGTIGPIPHDELYTVGGFKALYPRDPSLPASESVHCHCVSVTVIDEGSAQAVAAGTPVAKAQTVYTAAKADAAAPATVATTPGPNLTKGGAAFLGDPYGKAGLQALKPLANGSNGYGGEFLAKKLGYTKTNNPLVWDKNLKAFKHPKAPAGKQLPEFADLDPLEQAALMDGANLSPAAQTKIFDHLGIKKPTKPATYTTAPPAPTVTPAAPIPPPPPPPPVAPAPPLVPPLSAAAQTRPAGVRVGGRALPKDTGVALPDIKPRWTSTKPKTTPLKTKGFRDRIKALLEETRAAGGGGRLADLASPIASSPYMAQIAKDRIMRQTGADLARAYDAARLAAARDAFPRRYGSVGQFAGDAEQLASDLIKSWAATSGDQHPGAIAIQRAVADLFDLPWPPAGYTLPADILASADAYVAAHGEVLETFLRSMYAHTQAELDLMYPNDTHIRLVRGMKTAGSPAAAPDVQDVMLNPASSFAINAGTSKRFGTTLIWVEVPKERILGTALSGFGCLNEFEFVVIGARLAEAMSTVGARYGG